MRPVIPHLVTPALACVLATAACTTDAAPGGAAGGGLGLLDDRVVCQVPADLQPQLAACTWTGGDAACAVASVDRATYDPAGIACCVDGLASAAAVSAEPFDLALDLPPFSFLQRLFATHGAAGARAFATHVHEGGVSAPTQRLTLWRAGDGCAFSRVDDALVRPNPTFLDPGAGAAAGAVGAALADGGGGLAATSVDPGAAAPSWAAPALVRAGCAPDVLVPCEREPGAAHAAFVTACGAEAVAVRVAQDGTAAAVTLPDVSAASAQDPTRVACVTDGAELLVAWSETDASGSTEAWRLQALADGAGPWDTATFDAPPVVRAAALAAPFDRLLLTRFRRGLGAWWAAFVHRETTGEVWTGSVLAFGRSADGLTWAFGEDPDCPGGRCSIPDFALVGSGYVFLKTAGEPSLLAVTVTVRHDVVSGDPTAPVDAGVPLTGVPDLADPPLRLHTQADVVGLLYWRDWEIADPAGPSLPPATLRLTRLRLAP